MSDRPGGRWIAGVARVPFWKLRLCTERECRRAGIGDGGDSHFDLKRSVFFPPRLSCRSGGGVIVARQRREVRALVARGVREGLEARLKVGRLPEKVELSRKGNETSSVSRLAAPEDVTAEQHRVSKPRAARNGVGQLTVSLRPQREAESTTAAPRPAPTCRRRPWRSLARAKRGASPCVLLESWSCRTPFSRPAREAT